jgi:hypothetical protein
MINGIVTSEHVVDLIQNTVISVVILIPCVGIIAIIITIAIGVIITENKHERIMPRYFLLRARFSVSSKELRIELQ